MPTHIHSLLCLGDSYTIGESLPLQDNYPYQAIQLLRSAGKHFYAPEIVAQTGWTSFELADHLINRKLNEHYDFVSLLIGVNNQYRGLSVADFEADFEFLLKKAIHLANHQTAQVIVLSIPDWTCSPFAASKPKNANAHEIDAFNAVCKKLANKYQTQFLDITTDSRKMANDPDYFAADHLHYSAKAYAHWAAALMPFLKK